MHGTLLAREPGDLLLGRSSGVNASGPHREGEEPKPMMHGAGEVRPLHSSEEAGEQARATGGGVGGAKGGGQGEHGRADTRAGHQSRASVSQGLDRVRQAARQRKKERFTALLHHVDVDLLREAFFLAQAEGGARSGWA